MRPTEGRSLRSEPRSPGFYLRLAAWLGVALSWLVMLLFAWSAFATLPSPERLGQTRMVPIPTLRSVLLLLLRSGAEALVLLGLLWPWSSQAWTRRCAAAAVLFTTWFITTTPLSLSALDWVHRRWLALVTAAAIVTFMASVIARAVRLTQDPREVR
jgi:hypothetical protein